MERYLWNGLEYYEQDDARATELGEAGGARREPRTALVLHWGGASGRVGLPFARYLPGWRVIAPSLPGHGQTERPIASADACAAAVRDLLRARGVARLDRLYAYSLGAYVATRLFGAVEIAAAALLAGGVVPFGIVFPRIFEEEDVEEQPETAAYLAELRAQIATPGRATGEAEDEWRMTLDILNDIVDLAQPRLTLRHSAHELRPALESVWRDDPFRAPTALPQRVVFWNSNPQPACQPYVERFARLPGCEVAPFEALGNPFDPRWEAARRVIALLEAAG